MKRAQDLSLAQSIPPKRRHLLRPQPARTSLGTPGDSTASVPSVSRGTPVPHPELLSWHGGAKKARPVAISPSVSDPQRWRKRGEKLRTIAAEVADPNLRARLLRIADGYDLLAERAEQRAQTANEDGHEPDG